MRANNPGKVFVERGVKLDDCHLFSDIRIGYRSYANNTQIRSGATIGRFCSIGRYCAIPAASHHDDWVTTHPIGFEDGYRPLSPSPVRYTTIGSDVWIGNYVTIMEGVWIGDGAVLGAGAVVTKDVPPYSIAIGAPARVHRLRFSEGIVEGLLETRWWDYEEAILKGLPLDDLPSFLPMLRERIASGEYAINPPHHQLWR